MANRSSAMYCSVKCNNKNNQMNKSESNKKTLERYKERYRKERIDRYSNDINYRLRKLLRSRLNSAIVNGKSGSAVKDLGCSIEELKIYIESKFQEGMSWNNHSKHGWHIDHVVPLSHFDLANPSELKKACHYTNLQPLWAFDNLSKGDKV